MSRQILDDEALRDRLLPDPAAAADKDQRGRVLVVGGSAEVPGAALLTAEAALRAGAGKLQMAIPASVASGAGWMMPEARIFAAAETGSGEIAAGDARLTDAAGRCDAVIIGPGMLDEAGAGAVTRDLLAQPGSAGYVIDAAAMTALPDHAAAARQAQGGLILTPHHGEMARLMRCDKDEVAADPQGFARRLAESLNAVVVLKAADTLIVGPDGIVFLYQAGAVGLATSGSGDVLAGAIGGCLARGASPLNAALWGVYLHGQSGGRLTRRVGPVGFLAREIAGEFPSILAAFGPPR